MYSAHAAASCSAHVTSPKGEVVLRESLALAKMASLLALPFLLLSMAWI
ncbi:hypothetical protein [Vibrio sinaloensis]|nr:hypothetical protein [Vibrio sinaloensis]UPQ89723.1 hypothetical protein MTO69_18425 [Vibrio sinaloensis]